MAGNDFKKKTAVIVDPVWSRPTFRRFHRSSIVIDRAAGGNGQAVELLGRRSLVNRKSASRVASSAEKHAGDALAVLHIKGCESGEFRSSGHLAYELAGRAGQQFSRTWSSGVGNLVVLDGGTEHTGAEVEPDLKRTSRIDAWPNAY